MSQINAAGMDSIDGHFKISQIADTFAMPNIVGTSGTPALVIGSAAGSGSTASIVGNNLGGIITLNTGISLLSTGTVLTITYANSLTFPNGSVITFAAGNSKFASIVTSIYVTTTTTTAILSVALALSVSTTYIGHYKISGY